MTNIDSTKNQTLEKFEKHDAEKLPNSATSSNSDVTCKYQSQFNAQITEEVLWKECLNTFS